MPTLRQPPAAPPHSAVPSVDFQFGECDVPKDALIPRSKHPSSPEDPDMLTLIVARARNGAIGRNGDIPWHLPGDLKMFQRETTGGAVIMGRATWQSLPVKPLKNRMNIVVSRDADIADQVCGSVEEAISLAYREGYHRLYGIGGARIYKEMLPLADRLMLTEVDCVVEDADTYFPDFAENDWRELSRRDGEGDIGYVVRELVR